jgi:nucleoside-diphosphate-sugar epimerase
MFPPASENVVEVVDQIELHEADLLDLDALHQACRGVDYVLHEAAIPSVPRSVKDPSAVAVSLNAAVMVDDLVALSRWLSLSHCA